MNNLNDLLDMKERKKLKMTVTVLGPYEQVNSDIMIFDGNY